MERLDNLIRSNKDDHDMIKQEIKEVKEHAAKTNGSVANLKVWKGYLTGAIAILGAIVVPAALMLFAKAIE